MKKMKCIAEGKSIKENLIGLHDTNKINLHMPAARRKPHPW